MKLEEEYDMRGKAHVSLIKVMERKFIKERKIKAVRIDKNTIVIANHKKISQFK